MSLCKMDHPADRQQGESPRRLQAKVCMHVYSYDISTLFKFLMIKLSEGSLVKCIFQVQAVNRYLILKQLLTYHIHVQFLHGA